MAARTEDNTPLNSSILSRKIYSGGDTFSRKDDEAYNDSTNWVRIARSRWSNFVVPQVNAPLASEISPYSRLYERWSQ